MDINLLSARSHFSDEYYALGEMFNFSEYQPYFNKRILEKSKEDFLKSVTLFDEKDYDSYKDFEETFAKKHEMSYVEFTELLQNKYGTYLKAIEKKQYYMLFSNVKTIKSIVVFFTILWVISTLITVISLIVLLGKFSSAY